MHIEVQKLTDLDLMREACEFTMHSSGSSSSMSLEKMYKCEHSPMRTQLFTVKMYEIPNFVSVHFVRHKHGVEHFVQTMRDDRGADFVADRNTPTNHMMLCNAQAIVNMARKRLCYKAHEKTQMVMRAIKWQVHCVDIFLAERMVPECKYRGNVCNELKPCGVMPWK